MVLLNSDRYSALLDVDPETRNIFTNIKGFKLNDLFIQSDLSKTLMRIAKYGYEEFYTGKTSDYILQCMNRTDGIITKQDLKDCMENFL